MCYFVMARREFFFSVSAATLHHYPICQLFIEKNIYYLGPLCFESRILHVDIPIDAP